MRHKQKQQKHEVAFFGYGDQLRITIGCKTAGWQEWRTYALTWAKEDNLPEEETEFYLEALRAIRKLTGSHDYEAIFRQPKEEEPRYRTWDHNGECWDSYNEVPPIIECGTGDIKIISNTKKYPDPKRQPLLDKKHTTTIMLLNQKEA